METDNLNKNVGHFEYHFRDRMRKKIKKLKTAQCGKIADESCQTTLQPTARSTPDLQKRSRELTMSLEETTVKKSEEKRLRASTKMEEWVEVPARKNLREQKTEKDVETADRPGRVCPEAVLIKPAEKVNYAAIRKDFKKRVEPGELDVTVHGIRKPRSKDLLMELKCFKEDIGASGTGHHLNVRIEVEIADTDPSIEAEDVEDAERGFFDQRLELELKVSNQKTL